MKYILSSGLEGLDISEYLDKLKGFNIKKYSFPYYDDFDKKENVYIIEINDVEDFARLTRCVKAHIMIVEDDYITEDLVSEDSGIEIPEISIKIYDEDLV